MKKYDYDKIRKKLFFRSNHRGLKEMDLLLGTFALNKLDMMSNLELLDFEKMLDLSDQKLISWYLKKEKVPEVNKSKVLDQFLRFKLYK